MAGTYARSTGTLVIGGGPGGYIAAIRLGQLGQRDRVLRAVGHRQAGQAGHASAHEARADLAGHTQVVQFEQVGGHAVTAVMSLAFVGIDVDAVAGVGHGAPWISGFLPSG